MEDRRVRSNGFRVAKLPLCPWTHAAQVLRSQVFCKKAKLKFSSPGGTAQRPFQGRWLVLLDPNWFQQSHLAAIHRRRTAASGTNEFQVRLNSQLQRKYPPPELIGHRKRPLRDTHWLICKLTLICNPQQVDAGLLSAAVRRTRAAGSSAEGSPRVRPATATQFR